MVGAGAGQHRRQRPWTATAAAAACAILWLACVQTSSALLINQRPGNVLTMILTDCAKYQDWQTIAAAFAWRQSGQPGSMIRVANCNPEDTKKYNKKMLDYVDTHMAKQYAWYEPLKDWYAAYNKPGAVVDYFEHFPNPKEEWVVILDSDMLLKSPFLPEELPLDRGWAYAAHYDYLVGVNNDLALRHVPEIVPRNDTIAGPAGRRGDRVGGPYYMHRDDLKKLAPQWLNYTHIMRNDFEAYKDSGDTASKKGDRIWIAEMYGYSFGAAKTNIWHKWQQDFMLYPTYTPSSVPHVMHYGLIYKVGDWEYDKHWYFDFDVHKCPPWDLKGKPKAGIFPPPPYPDKLPNKDFLTQYRDLLAVSVIAIVNAAMCDYHVRNCPPSPQLTEVCDEAFKLYHAIDTQMKEYEWRWKCTDHNKECPMWAERGECKNSKQYMIDHCQVSCKYCTPKGPRPKDAVEQEPLTVARISKEVGVTPALPGSGAATGAADEAAKKAAEEKAAADKAAAEKAAAEKAAAEKAAAEKAAAEKAASAAKAAAEAAAAKAAEGPSEEELRGKYPATTLTYAALVKRCTGLHGLDDVALKVCLKAAGYKLLYAGIDAATSGGGAAAGAVVKGAVGAVAQQLKDATQPAATATTGGADGQAFDLAALHSRAHGSRSRVENMLSRTGVTDDSWSFAEQALLMVAVFGLGVFSYSRYIKYRAGKSKDHRSE